MDFGKALAALDRDEQARKAEEAQARNRKELANLKAQVDPHPVLLAARESALPDGNDLYSRTRERLLTWMEREVNQVENAQIRPQFREHLSTRVVGLLSNVSSEAQEMRMREAQVQMDRSLQSLQNQVQFAPDSYDDARQAGLELLAANHRRGARGVHGAARAAAFRRHDQKQPGPRTGCGHS